MIESATVNENQQISKVILGDSDNDELIAQMLQEELLNENCEPNQNGTKFNRNPQWPTFHSHGDKHLSSDLENHKYEHNYEDEIDIYERKEWDRFDVLEKKMLSVCMRKNGITNKRITIKSGKNYKSFNLFSRNDQDKSIRKDEHISADFESKIDGYGLFLIHKMIYNQVLKRVNKIIRMGDKAVILHGNCNSSYPNFTKEVPKKCIVKVFKNFSGCKTSRETVQLCGEREASSLNRLEGTTVHCPLLITHKHHVVVMSFIGENNKPAQKIGNVSFTSEQHVAVYNEIVDAMKTMYQKANVIHGSLSENSILWHNNCCYFIDFAQSLEPWCEDAFSVLFEDCYNILKFFRKKNVQNLPMADDLFEYITGCKYSDKIALMEFLKLIQMKQRIKTD